MNLIYQYWLGNRRTGVSAGIDNMKNYAESIGAEYIFQSDPKWAANHCDIPKYYNAFQPIYNQEVFGDYEKILFVDTDVFAVDGLEESIFNQDIGDIGICREEHQEVTRGRGEGMFNNKTDKTWDDSIFNKYGVRLPRNKNGDMKVLNSGVVVYTPEGREKARKNFKPFQEYINHMRRTSLPYFYQCDQNYLGAMLTVAEMNVKEMDNGWNTYIHYEGWAKKIPRPVYDGREDMAAKFVHVQLRNADNKDAAWHHTIVNKPQAEWRLP